MSLLHSALKLWSITSTDSNKLGCYAIQLHWRHWLYTLQATVRQRSRDECATFDGGINMCSYDSHEAMFSRLDNLAKRNPQLAQVGTVGKSREGRDLYFIKISSNVGKRSLMEPMFKVTFLPPFSHTLLLYLCLTSQMALLEFYHDSSLLSPMWLVFTLEHVTTGIVWERVHMAGVPERIGAV